jgi:hypothetical protein
MAADSADGDDVLAALEQQIEQQYPQVRSRDRVLTWSRGCCAGC